MTIQYVALPGSLQCFGRFWGELLIACGLVGGPTLILLTFLFRLTTDRLTEGEEDVRPKRCFVSFC